ncbi:glycosyltransferase family 1 protein, partial [Candidatus Desantisbacteria bacterium]|nr:glycosyltransferase family 1 protein [Candidatus Desantisbacteria bacterium]
KEFFTPGEEIVLFNKENFEDVIEYYLKNDNERERIAANGRKKNFEKLTARLNMKNVISKINEIKIDINKRPAKFLSEHEKLNSLGISNFYGNKYHKAAFLFSQALQIVNKDKKYLNNLSVTLMVLKALNNEDHPEVKNFLETVCKANEHAIIPRFNLLSYYKCIESDRNIFFALGADLIDDLRQKKYKDDLYTGDELFFFLETEFNKLPNSLIFRTEIEFLLYHYPNRGQEYQEKFYNTILWRIFEYVGDFYSDDGLYEESINCYQMVLQYCSMNEYVLEKISKAYIKLQQFENAEISLKNLLNLSPLHEEANYLLSEVEMKLNKKQEMKARLTRLIDKSSPYNKILKIWLFEQPLH